MGILDNLAALLSGGDRQSLQAPIQAPGVQPISGDQPQNMSIIASLLNGQKPDMGRGIRAAMTGMGNIGDAGGDPYRAFAMGMGGAGKAFSDQEFQDQKIALHAQDTAEEKRRWEEEMELKRSIAQRKEEVARKYGLSPQTGVDADGNPVLIQVSDDGNAVRTAMPEGVTLSKTPIKLDAGTHFVLLDPVTRQPVGRVEKDLAGAERDKVTGKNQGGAINDLPSALQSADYGISLIDEMIAHPGREAATGLSSTLDPRNAIPGTDATNFQIRAKQVEGQAFLEAFSKLRGAGQITEIEGQKATQAMARLDRAQSDEEYRQALVELKEILQAGKDRAMARAGITSSGEGLSDKPAQGKTSKNIGWSLEE